MKILVLCKRQYTNKDLIDDRFGRLREFPLALARRGHAVSGICLSYAKKGTQTVQDDGVTWFSIDTDVFRPWTLAGGHYSTRFFTDTLRPDVIWACSDALYGILAMRLGELFGIPYVFDLYDNFEFFASCKIPFVRHLYRKALRNAAHVTCVSRPLERMLAERYEITNTTVIENAVRKDLFRPLDKIESRKKFGLPPGAKIFGTAGALDKNRGIGDLFGAFEKLAADESVQLVVAGKMGKGVHFPNHPRAKFLGELKLETVPELFNALDVAVICNEKNEFGKYCFPQKAREIMACGTPVAASDVGVMSELLSGKKDCLYPSGDAEALARIVAKLWCSPRTSPENLPTWDSLAVDLERVLSRRFAP